MGDGSRAHTPYLPLSPHINARYVEVAIRAIYGAKFDFGETSVSPHRPSIATARIIGQRQPR